MIPTPAIMIRDVTLREGMDVPGVSFSLEQRLEIAGLLAEAGIREIEIVAPGQFETDLIFARALRDHSLDIRTTGLIYAASPACGDQIRRMAGCLDWIDLLMPLSPLRKPYDLGQKWQRLAEALDDALERLPGAGVGFPNATQAEPAFLLEMAGCAMERGASRITLYDTNGSADPFVVFDWIQSVRAQVQVPLFFHGHNDLGMAAANALAAILAGANGVDTTVNGLGDRAGNCPLETLAVVLALRNISTGLRLDRLSILSQAVAKASGLPLSPLTPVVGDFVFSHQSPGHLEAPSLFEAFDPAWVGAQRRIVMVDPAF